ncbi:MAG: hypothetical protein K2X77_20995 [Candidatus Obscuribacterales bacterium]|nr:hypothetical protein [Candidatus Obscuribacterales bacterium]
MPIADDAEKEMGAMTGFFKTRFAWALLTFLVVGVAAAWLNFGAVSPDNFPVLSWTGWTIKDYLNSKQRPNIVFLGSSLMLVPLDGVDADYLGKRVDGSQHHHSVYFEDKLKEKTGLSLKTFTFALPGEMPSDAYLIVNNLLKGKNKPDMIVYGVGPRDFLDNMLPSPAATDPFRYLSRFGKIDQIADRVSPEFFPRLDYELGKVSYFWQKRADISQTAEQAATSLINAMVPLPVDGYPTTFDERRLLMPDFRPCEVPRGAAFFRPTTAAERNNFVDNLAEYKKRYATMKWDTYISQMRFFADALDVAHAQGIKAVVVAMPITDLNRQLLSNLSWDAYRKGVLAMAKRKGASVIDLSESKDFNRSDFGDTVHLHSGGGKKFFDVVIDQLAKNEDALACFPEENRIAAKNKTTQAATRLPVSATVTTNAKQKLSQRGLPL